MHYFFIRFFYLWFHAYGNMSEYAKLHNSCDNNHKDNTNAIELFFTIRVEKLQFLGMFKHKK